VPAGQDVSSADPPEPQQPVIECVFERRVRCFPRTPTRTALQPSPFEWCARELPVEHRPMYSDGPRFSAVETRKARQASPDACCYVEFVATACD
jgi:hypothetical protein